MNKLILCLFVLFTIESNAQSELVDFESTPQYVTIDSLTGCWQIGTPSKTIFDTAYSSSHALMTDTLNPYPNDSISYAYFSFPTINSSSTYSISFKHRYDSETDVDGGYIEVYDCFSGNWKSLTSAVAFACPYYSVYYNSNSPTQLLTNGEIGFTGNSNGWITQEISFGCMAVFQAEENHGGSIAAQFRFVFVSDGNNTNQEGWMIDDIQWSDFGGLCSGIEEYENSLGLKAYPSITNENISFETETELFSKISIYDFSGKLIENFSFNQTNFKTLELSNLSNGMYFYSVEDGKAVGKFMIEK
jgi:hypothetical protein